MLSHPWSVVGGCPGVAMVVLSVNLCVSAHTAAIRDGSGQHFDPVPERLSLRSAPDLPGRVPAARTHAGAHGTDPARLGDSQRSERTAVLHRPQH